VDSRLPILRAALGFLAVTPAAPELQLLHRWLDTWTGVGLVVVGVERLGLRASLTHLAEGEWRATFAGSPMLAPEGFGVAATPWGAVQIAARAAVTPASGAAGRRHVVPKPRSQGGRRLGERDPTQCGGRSATA
jgi:hypothetical protein